MFKKENKEIKITRDEFVKKFMEVLANPFEDVENIETNDKPQMQFQIMMVGMLLCELVERKIFEEKK